MPDAFFEIQEENGCLIGTSPFIRRRPQGLVLFDRDDTLMWDRPGRVLREDHVRLVPSAREVLLHCHLKGFATGIVTNQSAIGRGLLKREALGAIMNRLAHQLMDEQDQVPLFQFWLACPHLPDDGCQCRKPKPGMIKMAVAMHETPAAVAVFGDRITDVRAAFAAGTEGHLVRPGQVRDALSVLDSMQ